MNDEDESAAFCFRCAMKSQDLDPRATPLVHNPFPVMILSDQLIAQTQPLIKTIYDPTYTSAITIIRRRNKHKNTRRVKPTKQELYDFNDWFIWHHETVHLSLLNRTPAKDLARLYLALAYDSIHSLIFAKNVTEIEEAWNKFINAEHQLKKIENSIAFVEELFATALALRHIQKNDIVPEGIWGGYQEPFDRLKERVLLNHEQNFQGFQETYKRIEPFMLETTENPFWNKNIIQPLIQSIYLSDILTRQTSLRLHALDAKENLDQLLMFLLF